MTVVVDTSMLIMLFDDAASPPVDRVTRQPIEHCRDRIQHFINTYGKTKGNRIVVPTPAISEFLVRVRSGLVQEYVGQIQRIRGVVIAPFSLLAAVELAEMQRMTIRRQGRIRAAGADSRAKVKFDQQIVAIAKVERASLIYSDDKGLAAFAKLFNIDTVGIAGLEPSPDTAQGSLHLLPREEPPTAGDPDDGL